MSPTVDFKASLSYWGEPPSVSVGILSIGILSIGVLIIEELRVESLQVHIVSIAILGRWQALVDGVFGQGIQVGVRLLRQRIDRTVGIKADGLSRNEEVHVLSGRHVGKIMTIGPVRDSVTGNEDSDLEIVAARRRVSMTLCCRKKLIGLPVDIDCLKLIESLECHGVRLLDRDGRQPGLLHEAGEESTISAQELGIDLWN